MLWEDTLQRITGDSGGKVKTAAVFDTNGGKLAATLNFGITSNEVTGLLKCVSYPSSVPFNIYIGELLYSCYSVDNNTVLGRASSGYFVARRCDDVILLGFTDGSSKVSCLQEIRKAAERLQILL